MCGPTSAIGLEDSERALWATVKDQLREPGSLAGLMRGFLGDREVAAVIATMADGAVRPVALLVSREIAEELALPDGAGPGWVTGRVGEYEAEVFLDGSGDRQRPVALRMTPWLHEYLVLYARRLWSRRR
jgi:hypothetical protein